MAPLFYRCVYVFEVNERDFKALGYRRACYIKILKCPNPNDNISCRICYSQNTKLHLAVKCQGFCSFSLMSASGNTEKIEIVI